MAEEAKKSTSGHNKFPHVKGTGLLTAARGSKLADMWTDGDARVEHIGERDRYFVDPALIPDGYAVEWKRISTLGQPDGKNIQDMQMGKWQPFPADVYKEMGGIVPVDTGHNTIEDGNGNVLMIRPKKYSDQAKAELENQAKSQLRAYDQMAGGELNKSIGYDKKGDVKTAVVNYGRSLIEVPA
jgi:hypothetical protein